MAHAKPNLIRFIDQSDSPELNLVLRGHLHLEAILNEVLYRKNISARQRDTFIKTVQTAHKEGRISEQLKTTLLAVNALRNKLAHELYFQVTFDDAFDLATKTAAAGIDFSDDTIHLDRAKSQEQYGIDGILTEVISNTFQHLVWASEDMLSRDEISDFLG